MRERLLSCKHQHFIAYIQIHTLKELASLSYIRTGGHLYILTSVMRPKISLMVFRCQRNALKSGLILARLQD